MLIMEVMYWKAIIKYGHVGHRNEVCVARHLVFPSDTRIEEVIAEVNQMPGTKNNCIQSLYQIRKEDYERGKELEKDNFYLQNLFGESA